MNIKDLLEYNQRGIFPFPGESEQSYRDRLERFPEKMTEEIPITLKNPLKWHEWDWARSTLVELFDVCVDWPQAYYTNEKLLFWQGAMTWIFQTKKKNLCVIQLRKCLQKKKYLFLYDKDEILAHEAVHAARMPLNSSKTEEFFAYWTATSYFRKVFGPIVQKPFEATIFMGAALCIPVFQGFSVGIIPLFFLILMGTLGLFRLFRIRKKIHKAFGRLKQMTNSSFKARAVLFRMTDEEIFNFSKWSIEEIEQYIFEKREKELRWQIINLAYSLIKIPY